MSAGKASLQICPGFTVITQTKNGNSPINARVKLTPPTLAIGFNTESYGYVMTSSLVGVSTVHTSILEPLCQVATESVKLNER